MKSKLLVISLIFVSVTVFGYYRIPELPEMVEKSDLILIGDITARHPLGKSGLNTAIKAWIKTEKIFKGKVKPNEEVVVFAQMTDSDKVKLIEDPHPAFPEKGDKVLLFLSRQEAGFSLTWPKIGAFKFTEKGSILPPPQFSLADLEKATKKGR